METKKGMSPEEAAGYFTQYCNYQFDDDAIGWMLPLFKKICAEVSVDFGNISDNITEVIHSNLHEIAETPSVLEFLENEDWEEDALNEYIRENHEEYIIDNYDGFRSLLGISNAVEKNRCILEAIYTELSPSDSGYYELNGYANGFSEVDLEDYKCDAISDGAVESEEAWDELEDSEKLDIAREWNCDIASAADWWDYLETFDSSGYGDVETQIANLIELNREISSFGARELIYLDNYSGTYYSYEDIKNMHLQAACKWKLEKELEQGEQ